LKISRIGLISRLGRIQITVEVYEELSKCKYLIKPLVYEIQQGNIGLAESSDYSRLQKKYQRLGIGELSVIASAKQKIAFIEDREAENAARVEGLKVYNIPEVLLAGKLTGKFEKAEILEIISELREKDGYLFKKEIEKELIR
jgi:predicted nucleic acid-binding protein